MSPSTREVQSLLIFTRRVLDNPRKWGQGAAYSDTNGLRITRGEYEECGGRACLFGALYLSNNWSAVDAASVALLSTVNAREGFHQYASLGEFNDAKETKHRDIIAVLDKTIENMKG